MGAELIESPRAQARPSMFTEPGWIETAQECWPTELGWRHWRSARGQRHSGHCLLGCKTLRRHHGLFRSRVLALNQSLDPYWDQVFIEFNGFYGDSPSQFKNLLNDLLNEISGDPDWDELRISGLRVNDLNAVTELARQHGLRTRMVDRRPAWHRQLHEDRRAGSILPGLSSNTRQQIRRSRRALENAFGTIELKTAKETSEALQWFDAIAPWHIQRWSAPDGASGSSGFSNPFFVNFHRALIRRTFDRDQIRLWRMFSGDRLIAMLYNFRVSGTESFYLGATDPTLDPGMRPGLVAHQSVMDRCLGEGLEIYDFMAGDSQYKRQLSNRQEELVWLVVQRPQWKFRIEDSVRVMRDRLKGVFDR